MPESRTTSLALGIAAPVCITLAIATVDIILPGNFNGAIAYGIPIAMSAWSRRPIFVWSLTGFILIAAFAGLLVGPPPVIQVLPQALWFNRSMVALSCFITALLVGLWMEARQAADESRRDAELRSRELETANRELALREEEVTRQNEELQQQTEELERQTEELRISNEELARRESMLQSLLSLSRSLTAKLPVAETMNKICRTLGALANVTTSAAAILHHEGNDLRVVCHVGFGDDGPARNTIPYELSIASLVMERGRTGYIEDLSLRPEMQVPQLRQGRGNSRRSSDAPSHWRKVCRNA